MVQLIKEMMHDATHLGKNPDSLIIMKFYVVTIERTYRKILDGSQINHIHRNPMIHYRMSKLISQ